ncbi:MAG: aminodeoxychorismate/anthranilate synthase component II [Polyangiaceae bacterium]|nr:aminodeoxychorismate/anthranilate synthase component II [Polyangiaceae bacterium]
MIDNHDSFTYNLARYLQELGAEVRVLLNDAMSAADVLALGPTHLVLSPGAGTPADAGISKELVSLAARERLPTLGVCLGHQVIGEAFGGRVSHARRVMHGKASPIWHDGSDVFAKLPRPFLAGRYHSLVVDRAALPDCLAVTAWTSDEGDVRDGRRGDEIMGLAHRSLPIFGVQFHPESILSEHGHALLANFLGLSAGRRGG